MGQCASVTQHAIEAVSGAHKSSKSPVETEAAKVPCSAITPLAGPGLERCSARRPTVEATAAPAPPSKPLTAPEAAPRQHLEHPGNISANTALTAVSEEPSERSSSSEQSSSSEVTDSSSTEASESSSSEPSEHASQEQETAAALTAEPYYPNNPARVTTDKPSYPDTQATASQPASPVAAVPTSASLLDSPTASPGATSESTASPQATSESNISSAATPNSPASPASAPADSAATSDSPVAPIAPQVLKPGHSRHARRLSSDRLTMTPAIPRVKRRMSGGAGMKMFASNGAEMIPANPVVPRGEAPARVRKMGGMKRDDSWFVLGYDSNTSSQHYRNLTAGSRHNNTATNSSMEDSWSGLALPSQHYIPKNTQLRKMKNDDLTVDSWAGMSIPSLYKNGGTDTESVFENSFATCTTRMSSGVDDDLLSLCESSMKDGSDSMNGSLTVTEGGVLSLGQQQQQNRHVRAHSMDDSCMLLEDEGAVQPVQPPRRRSNSAGPEESASLIMQGQLA